MYISIDIETAKDQVLELAAVLLPEGVRDPQYVCKLPYFHYIVRYERLSGSVVARIIKYLSDLARARDDEETMLVTTAIGIPWCWPNDLGEWLITNYPNLEPRALQPLGHNVGSFDMKFLERVPKFPKHYFHYRSMEVGSLFATRNGAPSMTKILEHVEKHEALYDARRALAAAMAKWQRDEDNCLLRRTKTNAQ